MSNREISVTILVGLSIIYMLCSKNLRAPLSSLCKAVILVIKEPAFRLLFCYQIICLCILSFVLLKKNLDLWMIKDYILIVVFSIIPTIVKINSVENQSIIKHYLLSSFTLTGILAFITDTYNFSIIGELILNITLILLVIFQVVSEEQGITSVKAFCNFCLFILLMFTITHSFLELIKDLDSRDTFLILLDYFSDFIFWTLNIPLLFAWRYIGQFDVMENFLSTKKTARSLFKHFIELLFKKFKYSSLSFDKHIITNIQIGGLVDCKINPNAVRINFTIYHKDKYTASIFQINSSTRLLKALLTLKNSTLKFSFPKLTLRNFTSQLIISSIKIAI
ncbi:hypothetical protein RAO19_01045 [Pediococcus acidilactici]